ncbi:MAG: hypothetical protein WBO73_16885, partial [Gammaproteobacteria bacterium]
MPQRSGTPPYGTSQMQQPQSMPGSGSTPAYGTPPMQQPQTTPGTGSTPAYGTQQMQQPQTMPGYGYGAPGYGAPGYNVPPYGGRDYGSNVSPFGGSGPSFKGPWDSGRGGRSMPWGGGSNMPWDNDRGGRSMPWGGGRNMPWDSGRGGFMDKDRLGDAWDDMLNKPSDMGTMPGGWSAPSVSVPNPVDVGDELGTAAEDLPDQMRNVYEENRRYNSYDRGEYGY